MNQDKTFRKGLLILTAMAMLAAVQNLPAQDKPATPSPTAAEPASTDVNARAAVNFNDVADKALQAMKRRAEELHIKGVAVVACSEGDTVQSWSSKMVVVGHLSSPPSKNDPNGANLLGIAYTKAAEMADTLKDSGSHVRPPKTGEYGWQGGVVTRGKTGVLIAAFSGGPSEDDVKVSKAGLAILAGQL
jgi:hypothetical protein